MTHHTYCEFQIGDSLIHLHWLRAMAKRFPDREFIHGVKPMHFAQMDEVIADLPNVWLVPFPQRDPSSLNIWKNRDGFWERHPLRNDYANFHLDWFRDLTARMGLGESPFRTPADLLFDYPALLRPTSLSKPFDVLFINSAPCSGQFRAYLNGPGGPGDFNPEYFDPLIAELAAKNYRVVTTAKTKVPGVPCTLDYGLTCTGIGNLSLYCPTVLMVSTGPSWPTFNVWNRSTVQTRVAFLDTERLNLVPGTFEVQSLDGAREVLRSKGI
jgi:hypothetical protein